MATSKKTTGNLVWLILCCIAVLAAPKFFFSQTEDLTIELNTKNGHKCDVAEFFGGTTNKTPYPNYVRFAIGKYQPISHDQTQLTSTAVLKKPFNVLRIDPCTQSGEVVEITGLTLTTKTKKLQLTPTELNPECTNCDLKQTEAKTLLVTVHGADSQLVVKNLDQKLFTYSNKLLEHYQKLRIVALVILAGALTWVIVAIFKHQKSLLAAFGISNFVALILFYGLYKKRLVLGFNLPFGEDVFQSGLAFMHHNMYSRYTDLIIYVVPLLVSVVIFSGILWWQRRKN